MAFGALVFLGVAATAMGQPTVPAGSRVVRVEQWLRAIYDHDPGSVDTAAAFVASWPNRDLHTLLTDARVLTQLLRNPRRTQFSEQRDGERWAATIHYSASELERLKILARILACAAPRTNPRCVEVADLAKREDALERLRLIVQAGSQTDGDNGVLRRGALLHTDIAMLIPAQPGFGGAVSDLEPLRIQFSDGQQTGVTLTAVHWSIARMLLDAVRPEGSEQPAPAKDDMVRTWYHATAAWEQANGQYEPDHLNHGRRLFPADPDLLFLTGTLHETFAGSNVQNAMRTAILPAGITVAVKSERAELREAEDYFRRALKEDSTMTEARLRLGHVLVMQEHYADAATELRQTNASPIEPLLQYYVSMFLGAAEEALGRHEDAAAAYSRAASLYPTSQSPRVALSALARRRGDRTGAWLAMQQGFALPANEVTRNDPWWIYAIAQGRDGVHLLDEVRRPFRREDRP